jgi:hypothetical protein
MRVILSRKGFDSTAGGHPSPEINGKLVSIPIPCSGTPADPGDQYANISSTHLDLNFTELMVQLGITSIRLEERRVPTEQAVAHLDPLVEPPGDGVLGHSGSTVRLLADRGVTTGDLFLFFGWFRPTEQVDRALRWRRHATGFHAIWGYLQIGEIITLATATPRQKARFADHPHVRRVNSGHDKGDVLYVATPRLVCRGLDLPGSGRLTYRRATRLTAPGETRRSHWRLPACFDPQETPIKGLSPNIGIRSRFTREDENVLVESGGRGQEFVARANDRMLDWITDVLRNPAPS